MNIVTIWHLRHNLAEVYRDMWIQDDGTWQSPFCERNYQIFRLLGDEPSLESLQKAFPDVNPFSFMTLTCGVCGKDIDRVVRLHRKNDKAGRKIVIDLCPECVSEIIDIEEEWENRIDS